MNCAIDSELSRGAQRLFLKVGVVFALGLPLQSQQQTPTAVPLMAKDATPQFEVAVVKPADPGDQNQGFHLDGHRIFIENESMSNLISFAFAVHRSQIVDAPAWFEHERFDIKGVPDGPGEPDLKQMQQMLQKLLLDRFKLKLHHDRRQLSTYAITIAKTGPKIAKSAGDPKGLPDQTGYSKGAEQFMKFTNNAMTDLALCMQGFLDRPVIDNSGLLGRFDFTLTWTPEIAAANDTNAAPGVFTAFQEQLGLRLQPTKGSVDVLVVEHVERPTDN